MNFEKLTESIAITIIRQVISKVEEYISIVDPQKTVIIAFDGVAPVAKLEQQRQRRYKSWYQNEISKQIYKSKKIGTTTTNNTDAWNTAAITPGTIFMSELNTMVDDHFKKKIEEKIYLINILVSGSNQPGEGEHKLFDYIRVNPDKHSNEITVIYGLDADLIMLSINHLPICPKIYLFRETPHFIQSIDSSLEPNSNYFLDIPELTDKIIGFLNNEEEDKKDIKEKENNEQIKNEINKNKVYDYIFICFFLGNDFLPHFPALNIRTGGVDKMLKAYRATVKPDEFLTDGKTINWKNVRKLISYLSSYEHEYIIEEHKTRDYKERNANRIHLNANKIKSTKEDDEFKSFENCPQVERELEKYIDPFKPNWQRRYYRILLNIKTDTTGTLTKDVAINYLQGLEWTMKYYTTGCADWRWQYKYSYPPLLQDLIKYVPVFPTEFVSLKPYNPVTEIVQLCYVLPRHSLHLLPKNLGKALITNFSEWYPSDCEFVWAYCRYFWESHAKMNDIDIKVLEQFLLENKQTFV